MFQRTSLRQVKTSCLPEADSEKVLSLFLKKRKKKKVTFHVGLGGVSAPRLPGLMCPPCSFISSCL